MDVSGFGLRARIVASTTFPVGVDLTKFADDADPLDVPTQAVASVAAGLNGDLVAWTEANPIQATLNVIPNSEDDLALAQIVEANRAARGKIPARDVITLTIIYPDGRQTTLNNGVTISGPPALSVASAGRLKTRAYVFAFEGKASS